MEGLALISVQLKLTEPLLELLLSLCSLLNRASEQFWIVVARGYAVDPLEILADLLQQGAVQPLRQDPIHYPEIALEFPYLRVRLVPLQQVHGGLHRRAVSNV